MRTSDCLQRFYSHCKERGISLSSVRGYQAYLRHFADEYPELPTDTESIEAFLRRRKEGPGHRGNVFKRLQGFYSYLAKAEGIKSPVPSKGKVGRPPKHTPEPAQETVALAPVMVGAGGKLVGGGTSVSKSISLSTARCVLAFIKNREVSGASRATLDSYGYILRKFMFQFPKLPLNGSEIDPFFGYPSWSVASRQDARRVLAVFYHWLEAQNNIPKGLVVLTKIIGKPKLPRQLSADDVTKVWFVTNGLQEKAIIAALLDTKCRASELLSLTRERVFPDHALVTGKVGDRVVSLRPGTYHLLCALASSGPLFVHDGKLMTRSVLYDVVHAIMIRAGLSGSKLGPHVLRHTSSVQHIVAGGDMMSLQQELGHAKPQQTAHYAHLATDQLAQKHQEIDVLGHLIPEFASNMGAEPPAVRQTAQEVKGGSGGSIPPPAPPPPDGPPVRLGIKTRKLV